MHGLLKLAWVEIKLLTREPLTLMFSFALPLLVLLVLGGIFGNQRIAHGQFHQVLTMQFYVPGYIGLVVAPIGTISLPVHLASYREHGVLRRFRASGVPEWMVLGAQFVVSVGIATIGGLLIYALGALVYGVGPPKHVGPLLLAFIVGVFAFSAIGVLLAGVLPTARAAQAAGLLLWFTMMFVSGTAGPLDLLPGWLLLIGKALPLYHLVFALEGPWNQTGTNAQQLLTAVVVGLVATLLALRVFRWE